MIRFVMAAFLVCGYAGAEWVEAEICRANQLLDKQKKTIAAMKKNGKGKPDPKIKALERDNKDFEKKLQGLMGEYEKTVGKPFDLASCGKSE